MQPFRKALVGARFEQVSLVKYLCVDGSYCPATMDGWPNYFDRSHLSFHGATKLTPAFVDVLQRVRSR